MQEAKEVTVILKDESKRMSHKFLIYDDLKVSQLDTNIQECIRQAEKSFEGQPESIKIKVSLEVL